MEISPRSLRIGNYLSEGKVVEIGENYFRIQDDSENVFHSNCIRAEPIPLTSEWLLKFGFTQSSCNDSRNIFDRVPLYENNVVAIMLSDSEFWYVTRQYDGGSSDPFERVLEVKSVHQVQNLYYALTGEELTIQEKGIEPPMMGMSY